MKRYCFVRLICLLFLIVSLFSTAEGDELELIGQLSYWDVSLKVAIDGNYAYTACGVGGFRVIDVSDPRNPEEVGSVVLSGDNRDVVLSGSHAFVACGNGGLRIVNVSSPSNPREAGHFQTLGKCTAVAVQGNYAYVVTDTTGIYVLDIENPVRPELVGSNLDREVLVAYSIAVQGEYVYIPSPSDGLLIFNISDPSSPEEAGVYELGGGRSFSIAIEGEYAYFGILGEGNNLLVLNVSDPENIELETECLDLPWGYPSDLAVYGDILFVAAGVDDLKIMDISNPTDPSELSEYETPGFAFGAACSGSYCYVASSNGLRIIRVSNPERPTEVGYYWGYNALLRCIDVNDDYAYIADEYRILRAIDCSDPGAPVEVSYCNIGGSPSRIQIEGNNIFIAALYGGLRIVSIVNPRLPVEISSFNVHGDVSDVAAVGDYAFIAAETGFWVISVEDPSEPVTVAQIEFDEFCCSKLSISGDYAYVIATNHRFYVIDISDPEDPTLVGVEWANVTNFRDICVYGNYAFVYYTHRIFVYDVSNLFDPVIIGTLDMFPIDLTITSINATDGYLFLTDNEFGLKVYDYSDPDSLIEVAFYDSPGIAQDLKISNNKAYLADYSYLEILDCSEFCQISRNSGSLMPVTFAIDPAWPNPFNSSTRFSVTQPWQADIDVSVFDINGRKIATLTNGWFDTGMHTFVFNAADLSAGIYFINVSTPGKIALSRKLALTR